jgi:hypothetical protein
MAFGIPGINSPSLASATVQGANLMHQLGLPDPSNPTVSSPTSAASAAPDSITRCKARSSTYDADVLRHAGAVALVVPASASAVTVEAMERTGSFLGEVGSKAVAAAGSAVRAALPVAGEALGAAGLVLTMQSPAGESAAGLAKTRAFDAAGGQRVTSTAHPTATEPRHTAFPGQRIDAGTNHTTHPTYTRSARDGILVTPAETQTKPAHTGYASPDLPTTTKSTGTAILQPKALNQATLAKEEKLVTSAHAAHLAPKGSLAHADRATIDVERKVLGYALDPQNEVGKHKARVFKSALGYDRNNFGPLVEQIRDGIKNNPAIPGEVDKYGVRFSVDVSVTGPEGSGQVRTSWIYRPNSEAPDLTSMRVQK